MPRPPSRSGSIPAAWQYFLTSRQGVLRSRCRRIESQLPSGVSGRKSGPSRSSLMPACVDVGQHRPGRVEQDLPPLLVPLLGDVEVVLDAVGLEVADAGAGHRRDPAAGEEEHAHHRQVADALERVGGDGLQQGDRLLLGQRRRGVLLDAGGLDGGDVLGGLPGDQPLGGELLVGAAEHREPPGHGGRWPCRLRAGPACRA